MNEKVLKARRGMPMLLAGLSIWRQPLRWLRWAAGFWMPGTVFLAASCWGWAF